MWSFGASVAWAIGVYTSIATASNMVTESETFSGKDIGLLFVALSLAVAHALWTLYFLPFAAEIYILPSLKRASQILSGWCKKAQEFRWPLK